MISMIWISQTALRFADTEMFATILCGLILIWIVLSFKGDEEGGVTGLLQYLITSFVYFCSWYKFWNKLQNNNTLPQDERQAVNSNKENKKTKENPPPSIEKTKKKQKKSKRSSKKSFCKENTEPTVPRKKTKMFTGLGICEKLNRDRKSIYENLHKYILTDTQLRMNHFPCEGFHPYMQVADGDVKRLCARCKTGFEIFNGLYLSDSKCHYHPKKPAFMGESRVRLHPCCDALPGSPPCTISNHHVTTQHRQRPLTKTASRRHVRQGLEKGIYSLDCEMCFTTDGLEVVRVALVDLNGFTVYEGFVKPKNKILDYNTMFSGVSKKDVDGAKNTIDDVKIILSNFIYEDTILVGHALNNDLAALGLIHNTIVDTSVLYADPRIPSKKTALKTLASNYLGITIQDDASGHDCIEDARAALQLALLKVPAAPKKHLSEQTQHQPAAEQQATAADQIYEPEYPQLPLGEIQNYRFPNTFGVSHILRAQSYNRPLLYNPQLNCYTPYLRSGV